MSTESDILKEQTKQNVINSHEETLMLSYIDDLRHDENLDNKEKIIKLLKKKYSFYVDKTNPNLPLYVWTGKIWDDNTEAIILETIYDLFGEKKTHTQIKEIYECLKGLGQKTVIETKPPELIAINNGLFNINTETLEPFNKKYFYVNINPHNYNPETKYLNFKQFEKDIHYKEDLDFIQEVFGYCLYTGFPVKLILMLIGNGDNGKSIELEVIKKAIGRKNNTSVTLQQLNTNPYAIAELYQKLTNISDDISNIKITRTGSLKTISDGGEITGRKIYGHPFDFISYAKIINSCNIPPEIEDDSEGIWNRLYAVFYPYKFVNNPIEEYEKQKIDKEQLLKSFDSEYEGILYWMIQGLIRLKKNNFIFSYNKSTKQIKKYYLNRANPVNSWINKELVYTGNNEDHIFKQNLYDFFVSWCNRENVIPIPSRDKFFKDLRKTDIEDSRVAELNYVRSYIGYKIVKEPIENIFFPEKENKPLIDCQAVKQINTKHICIDDINNSKEGQQARQLDSTKEISGQEIQDRLAKVYEEKQKLKKDLDEFGKGV